MNNDKIYANAMERNTIIGDKIQTWASDPLKNWLNGQRKTNYNFDGYCIWSRETVVWNWSADIPIWQLLIDFGVDSAYRFLKTTARSNRLLRQRFLIFMSG